MAENVRHNLLMRELGICEYHATYKAMREFTDSRDSDSIDEFWYLQHYPVFTQGLNGKSKHIIEPGNIPVINVDRGGQVTYHGPGQLVAYLLLDLARHHLGVKQLVNIMEQSIINLLEEYNIAAERITGAPGIYVNGAKIAALGLRIRRGFSYHGLAINVDMDLGPFSRINPCGYPGMPVTQLSDLINNESALEIVQVQKQIHTQLLNNLGYNPD